MLIHESSDVDFTLKKNTYMLISCQQSTSNTLLPKEQLNADFTEMHDHRDTHLTYDRVKC